MDHEPLGGGEERRQTPEEEETFGSYFTDAKMENSIEKKKGKTTRKH